MHDVLIRFKIIKNNRIFEAVLDNRLSFIENFRLLQNMMDINLINLRVFDPNKKIFLNRNIPLKEFNIDRFIQLYLF